MSGFTYLGVPIDSVGRSGGTEHAPAAFRERSGTGDPWIVADEGDLPVRIRGDVRDPASGVIGIDDVLATTTTVANAVERLARGGARPFVMGGCCSLVPGALAGAQRALGDVGLVYLDGHFDLYDGETSPTGEAADMPVSVVLGRGPARWAHAAGVSTDPSRVWLVGPRDLEEALTYGHPHPDSIPGLTVRDADAVRAGPATVGGDAAAAIGTRWVHLDVDVLDQAAFPATDYLMDGGLTLEDLTLALGPLVRDEACVGFSIGCYNPDKDPSGRYGSALADALRGALG
jgi:arginase